MSLEKTILGILTKLTSDYSDLSWKVTCAYSDGQQQNIYKISISETKKASEAGYVTFRFEDGCVFNCRYKALKQASGAHIVDTLLDILNLEKQLQSA